MKLKVGTNVTKVEDFDSLHQEMDKPTDMEIVLYVIKLLRSPVILKEAGNREKQIYARYAAKLFPRLSNPLAIRMLQKELDKINME